MNRSKGFSLVDRTATVLDLCKGKSVLHLGCTNAPYTKSSLDEGTLLHSKIEAVSGRTMGIDADLGGISLMAEAGYSDIVCADLEALDRLRLDEKFDVIVAGEMIEHLNNPGLFLRGIQRFMDTSSILLLTTINAYSAMRFVYYGLRGRGGEAEPVHPDHVAYYSYSTLKLVVERHGMRVDEFMFYDLGEEHRPHNRWFLNLINDIGVRIAPQWADGVIAICRLG